MTPTPATADPWWLAPAVIGAVVAAIVAAITLIVNGRRARRDRHRELFAAAFADIGHYCEFPYIVRRRRHDVPEEERLRISTELSEVQRKLNHNRAVLQVEAPRVAGAYARLVAATRDVAGGAIRDGWNLAPVTSDAGVHVTDVDLIPIKSYEDDYLAAAADHLALAPWWLRAGCRWLAKKLARGWRSRQTDPPSATPEKRGRLREAA